MLGHFGITILPIFWTEGVNLNIIVKGYLEKTLSRLLCAVQTPVQLRPNPTQQKEVARIQRQSKSRRCRLYVQLLYCIVVCGKNDRRLCRGPKNVQRKWLYVEAVSCWKRVSGRADGLGHDFLVIVGAERMRNALSAYC